MQTYGKEYVVVHSAKLAHNIEIRLVTKIVGNIVPTSIANSSKVALFYILQIGREEIILQTISNI